MKRLFYLLLIFSVGFTACDKLDIAKDVSKCIKEKVIAFDKSSACETGASVKEYSFQNKTVYIFDSGNCIADGTSEVTDADCNTLGYLGGLVGNTTINGENISNAEFKRVIWEK